MPAGALYVGRPTKWGNPYTIGRGDSPTPREAVARYKLWLAACGPRSIVDSERVRAELRGKDLACWCPLDQPCHADVLLEIANA